MRMLLATLTGFAILAVAVQPAAAGSAGLRAGFSLDPDDFLIGLHFRTDPLAKDLYFVPSVEAGFGDVTMIAGNADLHYVFETSSNLAPYAGGGLTVNWFDGEGNADSNTEVGGSVLGGIMLGKTKHGRLFLEVKLGLGDVPDAKFLVGWNIR